MTGFSTRAIKAATTAPRVDQQPNSVPIYQAVSFSADDAEELGDITSGRRPGYAYSRIANPTDAALEAAVAEIHGAEDAQVVRQRHGRHPRRARHVRLGRRPDRVHAGGLRLDPLAAH